MGNPCPASVTTDSQQETIPQPEKIQRRPGLGGLSTQNYAARALAGRRNGRGNGAGHGGEQAAAGV